MFAFKWTLRGLACALILLAISMAFNLALLNNLLTRLNNIAEASDTMASLIIPTLVLLIGALLDICRSRRQRKVTSEKYQIYRAMVQASDHILKNCLNEMMLVKLEAESSPEFDKETLRHFDETVDKALDQIHALGSLKEVDKERIGDSVDIKIFQSDEEL